jgi:hypothetical protein
LNEGKTKKNFRAKNKIFFRPQNDFGPQMASFAERSEFPSFFFAVIIVEF